MDFASLSHKTYFKATGFAFVLLFILMPMEYLFRTILSDHEGISITSLQDIRSHDLTLLARLIARSGTHYFLLLVLPFLFNLIESAVSIKICIMSTHVLYIYSFVGIIFTEPRPYWVDSSVRGLNCVDGYGFPSEGIFFGFIFYLSIILEAIDKSRVLLRRGLFILLGFWSCIMSLSEMYLGGNWPHQIGVTFALIFICVVWYFNLYSYLTQISFMSTYYNEKNRKIKVYWFISCMAFLLVINTVSANVPDFNLTNIIWIKNAYKHCSFSEDIGGNYTYNQSAWIFFNLGAIFGSHFSSKRLVGEWWRTNYFKRVIRGALSATATYFIYVGFSLIKTYDNPTTFGLNYIIPGYICGFFSFGIFPVVCQKIGLNGRLTRVGTDVSPLYSSGISIPTIVA